MQTWMPLVVVAMLFANPPADDRNNASTWYQKANDIAGLLSEDEWQMLADYRGNPSGPPSNDVRQILSRMGRAMSLAERGASKNYADYDLDYAKGYALELPHLSNSRRMAWLMQTDALVRLHDGDTRGATERIATIYRMGEHSGHDDIVISSLVGQVIWNVGDTTLQKMIDGGQLNAGDAALVLSAANDYAENDPYRYVEAMMMEQELSLLTIEGLIAGEEGIAGLQGLMGMNDELPPGLLEMTPDELQQDLDQYSELMNSVVACYATEDEEQGRAQMEELERALMAGEHGTIAMITTPALVNLYDRKLEGERKLQERIELLAGLAAGEIDALDEANAAVWYLRAIETLHARDAEELALLRNDTPETSRLDSLLDETTDIVAILEQASVMKRCDFSIARDKIRGPILAPPYAVGLRDLCRLVEAETSRRARARDETALRDRLRLTWSMLGHFQHDPMYTSAITTHQAFKRAVEATLAASEANLLDDATRAELRSLTSRLGRADPFSYVTSMVTAREALSDHFGSTIPSDTEERSKLYQRLRGTVGTLESDVLLYVAAAMDTLQHASQPDYDAYKASFEPLDGVYDLAALARARADSPRVAQALSSYEIEPMQNWTIVDFASITERSRRARQDLRRGLQSLEKASAATAARPDETGDSEQGQ
jgi:hypothetical protein